MRFQAAKTLEALGFSQIESLVYCFLLEESPATGYRVSHGIGKPTANTYKAIAALAQRGAIIVDDSESRLCRAVPPGELLDRLNRDFDGRRRIAENELSKIRQASGDDRVYYLTSVDQVLERARSMLNAAKSAALLELFPRAAPLLGPELEAAAQRGVHVAVKAYAPIALRGVIVVTSPEAQRVLSVWPGQQVSIAVDGEQFMTALLSQDATSVHQALWSNSTFLSCFYYNALNVEQVLTDVEGRTKKIDNRLNALSLTRLKPPGFQKLNDRYGDATVGKRPVRARKKSAKTPS
jgi:HTH-type transcriptional regulator, sugar sensing transcriptional regulator